MDPAKLKVVDLRAQLSQRGLDTKGNKAVLVERLRKAIEEETKTYEQERDIVGTESTGDTIAKDGNEKEIEASKLHSPKQSGRSSRNLPVTPTTKIATRSAPRTATTLNKQLPVNKSQHTEKIDDLSSTTVQSCGEEHLKTEETQAGTSSKMNQDEGEEEEEESISIAMENQINESVLENLDEKLQSDKSVENDKDDSTVSEEHSKKLLKETNETKVECPEKFEKRIEEESDSDTNDTNKIVTEVTAVTEISEKEIEQNQLERKREKEEKEGKVEVGREDSVKDIPDISINEAKIETEKDDHRTEEKEVIEEITKDTERSMEVEVEVGKNIQEDKEINVVKDSLDIPEVKGPKSSTIEREEKMDVENLEKDVQENEKVTTDIVTMDIKEEINKEVDDKGVPIADNEQDTDMAEQTQEEEMKTLATDLERKDRRDKKRKRSPSPADNRPKSPIPAKIENEPEIDDTAMILSWYDSDLNLNINKDGFLAATPMYNESFCYTWAGVRSSYGFTGGKLYYEVKITELCPISLQNEEHSHLLRVGWSVSYTNMQLGEEKLSYGYDGSGNKITDNIFTEYGSPFGKDDIVGCYLDSVSSDDVLLSYTLNGKELGVAFNVPKDQLNDKALFPHILSKNCSFTCNFGQKNPWSENILEGYIVIGDVDAKDRVPGPRRPEKRGDCEIIMMCGLPAAGKTIWAKKHVTEYPEKMYNLLGIDHLIDKMKNMGIPRKSNHHGRWDAFVDKCSRALNKLIEVASGRRRNYILDQTNVYPSAQRRKMRNFYGYQRKAVVVVPTDEEFKLRTTKHEAIESKDTPDSTITEMKANFSPPVIGEFFDIVEWVELNKEEGKKLIERYNKEAKEIGSAQQLASKRPRYDGNRETRDSRSNRETRDNRDYRDRRSNFQDRNRNPIWRGGGGGSGGSGNMGGRRDRPQRGGHLRHGGGYGPPAVWRGRGPILPPHRGADRRSGNDRRMGNDRSRPVSSRQSGWGPMNNYQGSQQSGWGQQSQSQQGNWGQQQWSNWKGYGQGSYGQSNYNQQGYGNGNWNSWNQQQYYNQYWGQQQQTGQTTTSGGQAVSKQ